ncbi:MAG TPA: ATP-dependent sacrificial sulfur transferase LarE [Pyrinomonadaceae bacterium]|nr:ATP-dependent sacrificial sulfur transferase LarE [Pyrinomonadaceae bacterium]
MDPLASKLDKLREAIARLPSCAVAFSGGVDSTLVLKVAHDVLGDRAIAVTALSESLPNGELEGAEELARTIGAKHFVIQTFETRDENYLANAANRCYFCKTEMYARIGDFAHGEGFGVILDGLNVDDLDDRRPGRAAAIEYGVISPLVDAGLTKIEVRELSRKFDLPTWDKPALACLSSRIPHGTPITLQSLSQVDRAETFLRKLGVGQVRVRHHGETARIEVEPRDFSLVHSHQSAITSRLNALGFREVVLDPEGYRTGNPLERSV